MPVELRRMIQLGSAPDGEVGFAVAVVVAADGLRAGLCKYDCLDVAVAAVYGRRFWSRPRQTAMSARPSPSKSAETGTSFAAPHVL